MQVITYVGRKGEEKKREIDYRGEGEEKEIYI